MKRDAKARALAAAGSRRWVVGRMVPDPRQRHGFYLDPASVSLAEVTDEAIRTTVEQVSERPGGYAPGGASGFNNWALVARPIRFVPAR